MNRLSHSALHDDSPLPAATYRSTFETHDKYEAIPVPAKNSPFAWQGWHKAVFAIASAEETTESREKFTGLGVAGKRFMG